MKYFTKKFDSVNQYLRYLNTTPTSSLFRGCELRSQDDDNGFRGTSSYQEADDLFRYGDKELWKKVKAKMTEKKVIGGGTASKNQYFTDVCGFVPHIANYVQGLPNNMINKRVVRYKSSKVISVVYNPTVSYMVSTDDMINVSLKVMDFVAGLESKGYRVNLYTMLSSSKKNERVSSLVRIKSSEDYTDKLKLVYPMVHPSMLRRHFFRFVETCEGLTEKDFTKGYGCPTLSEVDARNLLSEQNIKCDYYFDYYKVALEGIKID